MMNLCNWSHTDSISWYPHVEQNHSAPAKTAEFQPILSFPYKIYEENMIFGRQIYAIIRFIHVQFNESPLKFRIFSLISFSFDLRTLFTLDESGDVTWKVNDDAEPMPFFSCETYEVWGR